MSMLWPSLLFAMVKWMKHEDKISGTVNIASSMAAGTLLSYAMSALLIKYVNWGAAFWAPALAAAVTALMAALLKSTEAQSAQLAAAKALASAAA